MKAPQLILIFLMLLILAACDTEQTVPVIDNLDIELAVKPDPSTAGDSTLMVTVKDEDGNPIDDATVAVHGDMDHEGMIPVGGESAAGQDGMYHIPFEWTMGGGWILDVTVTLPGNAGIATETFELNVGAISEDSIINQGSDDTAGMDHNAMDNMGDDDTTGINHSEMDNMDDDTSLINIHYMSDNNPALAGDTNVVVMLTTNDGQPIDDASILLDADMPAHEMMPVTGTSADGMEGRYTVPVRWTMAGEWEVNIIVTLSDTQETTQTYTQQVVMADNSEDEMAEMPDHSG